jgi:YHS domain-containing protein/ElaB/YqjD/DUF883 family membrane-anchored ribosome-binding protein
MSNDLVEDNPVHEPTPQVVHDPVCHMDFRASDAAGTAEYVGLTYYFCSTTCHQAFDADPEGVLDREGSYDHDQANQPEAASTRTAPAFQEREPIPIVTVAPPLLPRSEAAQTHLVAVQQGRQNRWRARASELASRVKGTAQKQARSLERRTPALVRRKPLLTAIVAFVSGCLAGLLLQSRARRRKAGRQDAMDVSFVTVEDGGRGRWRS